MQRIARSPFAIILIVLLAFVSAGCNKLKARDNLNKGVTAYKAGSFDLAIEKFKEAKDLDPTLLNARLYLATAYASQYIPGAPSEENVRKGQQAIEEFQDVLKLDSKNLSAIDGIGSILFNMAGGPPFDPQKMEESRSYHEKHIQIDPTAPDPHYWVGVIEWTLAYRGNAEMRRKWNEANPRKTIKDDQSMPDKLREEFIAKYGPDVDNGLQHLEKAVQLRPDYEDAMAYQNLLYRQRSDMAATPAEREDFIQKADALVDKVKEIKQKKSQPAAIPQ